MTGEPSADRFVQRWGVGSGGCARSGGPLVTEPERAFVTTSRTHGASSALIRNSLSSAASPSAPPGSTTCVDRRTESRMDPWRSEIEHWNPLGHQIVANLLEPVLEKRAREQGLGQGRHRLTT